MTDSRRIHADAATAPITALELLVLSAVSGLALATAFTAFEFLHHAPDLSPLDVLIATALASGPAIVGTVGVVAERHGRQFIGTDLSWEYLQLAKERNKKNQMVMGF